MGNMDLSYEQVSNELRKIKNDNFEIYHKLDYVNGCFDAAIDAVEIVDYLRKNHSEVYLTTLNEMSKNNHQFQYL